MNKRRFQRAVLLTGALTLLFVGVYGLWLFQAQRYQYALNDQLIAALVRRDTTQALLLVHAGANPNTPYVTPVPLSLRQLWDSLFHRSALPVNQNPSVFLMVCGASWRDDDYPRPDAPQLAQAMLQHGAHLNAKDGSGETPLMCAAQSNYPQTLDVLLGYGADINGKDEAGFTPLMEAAANDASDTVNLLLERGADVNSKNRSGETALFWAVRNSAPPNIKDVILQLIKHGADPDLLTMAALTSSCLCIPWIYPWGYRDILLRNCSLTDWLCNAQNYCILYACLVE